MRPKENLYQLTMTTIDNNIQETRVSFLIAKLLKEAGFDCLYCKYWNCSHIIDDGSKTLSMFNNEHVDSVKAPTQQVVIDWIRVNFGIHIYVKRGYGYEYIIETDTHKTEILYNDGTFNTLEEAKEAALEYCLTNLILKK